MKTLDIIEPLCLSNEERKRLTLVAQQKEQTRILTALLETYGNKSFRIPYSQANECYSYIQYTGKKYIGATCKRLWCFRCEYIKQIKNKKKYFPVIQKWNDLHSVTLTIKSCTIEDLLNVLKIMDHKFALTNKYINNNRKIFHEKFQCIKKLEIGFNSKTCELNPHFHLLVNNKEFADLILKRWIEKDNYLDKAKTDAQKIEKIHSDGTEKSLFYIMKPSIQLENYFPETIPILDQVYHLLKGKHFIKKYGFTCEVSPKLKITDTDLQEEFSWSGLDKNWFSPDTGESLLS